MKSTDFDENVDPEDDSTPPDGKEPSGDANGLPPVERALGFILDEKDEKKVAKFVTKLREDQAPARSRHRAVWTQNRWWREGRRWVRIEKKQDQNLWRAWLPPGMGSAPPVPNKTDRLIRRVINTINVDKPYPQCEPAGNTSEDKDAAEFGTQYLSVIGGADALNLSRELRAAMDKAATFGSAFGWVTMDPRGGGHRPRSMLAHPDAETKDDALIDPATGEPAEESTLTTRFQRPDGALTDDPKDADWQWMPKPKIRRLTGLQVDFLPATAKGIDDAIGVVITDTTNLGDLRAQFPDVIAKLTADQLTALCTWRPSKVQDILPPYTKEPEDQKEKGGDKDGQYKDSQMVVATTIYYRSCSEYALGAYAMIGGETLVLHRQPWTAQMPQPADEMGQEQPPKEECLDIPVAQCPCLDDDTTDDPYGIALTEKLGPMDELRASAFGYEQEHMYRSANPIPFLPVGSIVQPGQMKARNGEPVFTNPQGKPEWEVVPPLSQTVPDLREEMTVEMDDESGLQQAAQGVEDPSVKSGIHAQTIVQEALKAVANIKDNGANYYIRLCQIILQLTRAYCTVPELLQWEGKDGEFKAKEFSRTDFRNTKKVTIQRGSYTMHTLLAKQEAANNAFDRKVIDVEEYKELTGGNIDPVVAREQDPHYLRVRRQLETFKDGPTPEWTQAFQQYTMAVQQQQAMQAEMQQRAQVLASQGIQSPAPAQAPLPPKPPGPFDPRLPIDDDPMAAKVRHRQLGREMASAKFGTLAPEWQQVLIEAFMQDRNAAGVMTVPDVQRQQQIEAASIPPALPHGVTIAMKGDASSVGAEEQAAIEGFKGGGEPKAQPAPVHKTTFNFHGGQ